MKNTLKKLIKTEYPEKDIDIDAIANYVSTIIDTLCNSNGECILLPEPLIISRGGSANIEFNALMAKCNPFTVRKVGSTLTISDGNIKAAIERRLSELYEEVLAIECDKEVVKLIKTALFGPTQNAS
jgi:hypothetical protein